MAHPWVGPDPLENTSDSDPASLSPRTALLSPPPFEPACDDVLSDAPRRSPRGPGLKFRHDRERVHASASPRALMHMLVGEEYESKQMRKLLYAAFERLEGETARADAAEARIEETIQRAKAINEARVAAQQEAVRAQEELKLYKLQLANAQGEILRAQDVLKAIEGQRDEAEAAAVSARSKARRLNEERLIEMAREEGRRLGFEEGVRRGRRMGYREAYAADAQERDDEVAEVGHAVVDRLLESQDRPEHIEVFEVPTPIPPPSSTRSAPEVHRLETPVNSSLENQRPSSRSRRDSVSVSGSTVRRGHGSVVPPAPSVVEPRIVPAGSTSIPSTSSQASRQRAVPQPWPHPPGGSPFDRPISIQNSPPSVRHPEIHVLPDGYIPTADANHNISLPPPHELQRSIPSPTPSQATLGPAPERARGRDYIYGEHPPRRSSPDESLASTKQSAASTISQLDIVGLPASGRQRDHSTNLSVIHEDASVRSDRMTEYSQTAGSASQGGRNSFREMGSSETLSRDRRSKQRLADELRYSDPAEAERWRQQSGSSRRPEAPSRHHPSQITVPTPLSPPRVLQPRHERQSRSETRSDYSDRRRPLSSDSSVPEIYIETPSGPPSDAPSRGHRDISASGLLSPEHANHPLPVPAQPASSGRGSPVIPVIPNAQLTSGNPTGPIYTLPDSQLPPGFLPSPTGHGSSQRLPMPHGAPSSEREGGRPRSPISFYAASPTPAGFTYPAPPVSRSATYAYPANTDSNPPVTSEGRRRHDSLGASARRPVQTTGSADGGGTRVSQRQSTTASQRLSTTASPSRPSYPRHNAGVYHEPAYPNNEPVRASSDSLADAVTSANTAANGGGPVRPVRVRGSPGYAYATLRTNE